MNDEERAEAAVRYLLAEIVDSFEKLDIVVHLQRADEPQSSVRISDALALSGQAVAEALGMLARAGLVSTTQQDGAGWSLDPHSSWLTSVELLASVYDHDRDAALKLMTLSALDRARARATDNDVFTILLTSQQ